MNGATPHILAPPLNSRLGGDTAPPLPDLASLPLVAAAAAGVRPGGGGRRPSRSRLRLPPPSLPLSLLPLPPNHGRRPVPPLAAGGLRGPDPASPSPDLPPPWPDLLVASLPRRVSWDPGALRLAAAAAGHGRVQPCCASPSSAAVAPRRCSPWGGRPWSGVASASNFGGPRRRWCHSGAVASAARLGCSRRLRLRPPGRPFPASCCGLRALGSPSRGCGLGVRAPSLGRCPWSLWVVGVPLPVGASFVGAAVG